MNKWAYLLGILIILCGFLFYKEVISPPLPLNSVSKKEVINKVSKSSGEIIKIAEEDGYQWYISEEKQGKASENLKGLMKEKGWNYKKQVSSGIVFQSEQGEIIVLSSMWTKKYVIFHFPKEI